MKKRKRKLNKKVLYFLGCIILLAVVGYMKMTSNIKENFVISFEPILIVQVGSEVDLLKNVKAVDSKEKSLEVFVDGYYNLENEGKYNLYYVAKDKVGNEKREAFTLVVSKNAKSKFVTKNGFIGEIKNGVTYIDGTLIVNKSYKLPSTFGNGLTKETKDAFDKLKSAALLDGLDIYIASGFRSYEKQVTLYGNYVLRDGKSAADTYSARPGHSEHQSGLTFDVNEVSDKFHSTKEAKWLRDNCYKYGFILRFPDGKQDETGFKYESWHFRYVGEELAKKLYDNGDWKTLEGYYGIDSVYE